MVDFEIEQEKQLYYTKGLKKKYGYEFEIVLDDLTVKRVGMSAARDLFDTLLSRLDAQIVQPNLIIPNFFNKVGKEKPSQLEEILTVSLKKVVLKVSSRKNTLRIVFADPWGKWPWEYGYRCSTYSNQLQGIMLLDDLLKVLSAKTGKDCEFYFAHWLSVIRGSEDFIILELGEDTPQNREQFKTPIKSGYWVYTYLTCVDELHFERFSTKERAEQHYNSILLADDDSDSLAIEKLILEIGV